jgi:Tfp pilus assembly protein PilN
MKTLRNNRRAFANQLFIGVLVTICFGGSVGLGTVWMRHQISITAKTNRLLEASLAELERSLLEKEAAVETEQNYDRLRQRNEEWQLGLVRMSDPQVAVLPVAGDPVHAMAVRANQELFTDVGGSAPPARAERTARDIPARGSGPIRVTFQAASGR